MIHIKPRAFLFDFDGVICDTEKLHYLSTLKTVGKHNMSLEAEYYFEKLFGFDDRALFDHIYQMHGKKLDKKTLKQLMVEKNDEFMQLVETKIVYFDGVLALIERLTLAKIPLAVVSGALSHEVDACLEKGNIKKYFLFSMCADHVRSSKPDPESYERAYVRMGSYVSDLSLQDCWVLEDSPIGIASAKAAGLPVIAITNSAKRENLTEADHIIEHYSEIEIIFPSPRLDGERG